MPSTGNHPGFSGSIGLLFSSRFSGFRNLFVFGGWKTRAWALSILFAGVLVVGLDYLFFAKLIRAIQNKLEFLAPFMLRQLIHILFLSFFGLLGLSGMSSSVSGFFSGREVPFLLTTPVSPDAFLVQRFVLVFFQSSWMILIFGSPPFAAYAVNLGLGWKFIAGWFPVFILLLLIPVLLGSALGIVLMRLLPASRVNQALSFLSLSLGALVIILFRMSRPERLFMDVPQEQVMDFVRAMSVPAFPYLPTSWATVAVTGLGSGTGSSAYLLNLAALAGASAGGALLLLVVYRLFYRKGFASLDEGIMRKTRKGMGRIERALSGLPPRVGSYLIKDILIFIRDPARWTQLFLLGALVVLYVYNAYSFPMGTLFYRNLVAFLNLGISGFVLSTLCVRFVFPSVSLEGKSIWVTLSSPVPMENFFLAKYLFAIVPLCLISIALTLTTNLVMGVDLRMMVLFGLASVAMALALVGLNLGMGALFPRFDFENEGQIPASPGGVLTMIISMAYIGLMVAFLAAPVYRFFAAPMGLSALTKGDALFGILGAGLVSLAVAVVPVRIARKRVGVWS